LHILAGDITRPANPGQAHLPCRLGGDGVVDMLDFTLLARKWLEGI